jgi:large subunit ribosomal protein L10
MKKQEKISLVDNLSQELKGAAGVVLINFAGMGVKAQQDLKRRLKEVGAKLIVVKNTLLKRAAETAKIDPKLLEESILTGQTALVISSEDAIAPISILGKFAKEFEIPKMKVGVVDGTFQDEASLTKIASLPGRDALLGQVLSSLMGNLYNLVGTLQGPTQKLVYILNQKVGDYK